MKKILVVLTVFATNIIFGQIGGGNVSPMTALQSGDIKNIAKVKTVNIVYDYSEMGVGAFKKEADYIAKKYKDCEDKEKGKGDKFKESWEKAKTEKYPDHFEKIFNKYGAKNLDMTGTNNGKGADYTLTVKTTFVEPGMNIGIMKKPAFIDVEFIFTDKSGKELLRYFVKNAVGANMSGYDFDVSSRVLESYGKAAKMLVGAIKKDRKKAK